MNWFCRLKAFWNAVFGLIGLSLDLVGSFCRLHPMPKVTTMPRSTVHASWPNSPQSVVRNSATSEEETVRK